MKKSMLSIVFILTFISSYGQTRLFVDPPFSNYGNDHEIIAVIPFGTTISLRPKQMKELEEGQLEEMEQNESYNIQQSMYSWFLKRKQQGKLWVEVQDINKTNALLNKEGISASNLKDFTAKEIALILGVDAVINGSFETNKPMSDGVIAALGILVGIYGTTNRATINMFIHNAEDGKVLVNYNKAVSGSIGSSTDQLVNIIMRKASRRIPYTKPKE